MTRHENEELLRIPEQEFNNHQPYITNVQMFECIVRWLKEHSEQYRMSEMILDYALPKSYQEQPLQQWSDSMDISAIVNPGGSEGIYLDWYWHTGRKEDKPVCIGTFKTLSEGIDGYAVMGTIAGLLTWASWRFINMNYEHILEYQE